MEYGWASAASCGARRMADSAALLVEEVLPCKPLRQWVLSLPFALRFLLATNPQVLTQVLRIVYRTISGDLLRAALLFLDGVYVRAAVGEGEAAKPVFQRVAARSSAALQALVQRVAERIGRGRGGAAPGFLFLRAPKSPGNIPDRRSRIESARQTPIVEVPILALAGRRAITGLERQRRDIR